MKRDIDSRDIPLRILYLTHYFPPEVNAPAVRVSELARRWAQDGHAVTVQTGFPNHPNGVIPEQYRGKFFERERRDGVDVLRSYIHAAPNKGFLKRVTNYLSFMFSTLTCSSWRTGPVDVVIGTSPQFFVAVAAWITSLFKRAPFVFEVRDLWPEEIVAVGALKSPLIIKPLEWLEMFLYRRAALIVAVAQGTIDTLKARGVSERKMALIPNGVSPERFNSRNGESVRKRFKLNGEFLVSYIGTHGMAHKLETTLEAAERLQSEKDVRFMFVGDGAEKKKLMRLAELRNLTNVTFAPQVSGDEAPEFYAASDLCLAPLRKSSLFTRNIPSKLYEIMAAGKPIALGAQGESQKLVEKSGAGVTFEPENATELAERILTLRDNPQRSAAMGRRGRNYVEKHCRRDALAKRYIQSLRKIVDERSSG